MTKQFYFLFFCLVFFGTTVRAQLQKGTFYLSSDPINATEGFRLGSLDLFDGAAAYSLSPGFGYFVTKRLMLQGDLSFNGIRSDGEGFNTLGVGAGARFYINPAHPKNNFFVDAQPYWIRIGSDGESISDFFYSVGAGSTWFLAPGVSFDTQLSFAGPISDNNGITVNQSLSLATGLNFYLNPEMKANRKSTVPALQKGKWMIGGSSGNIGLDFDPNSFSLSLVPRVGYFVSDRLAVGANLGAAFQRSEFFPSEYVSTVVFTLVPTARYYFGENNRLRWFAGSSLGLSYISSKFGTLNENDTLFNLSFNGGFNLFLTPNFALEAGPYLNTDFDDVSGGVGMGFNYFIR